MDYSPWGRKESDMTERLFNTVLKKVACCAQNSFQFLQEVSPCAFLLPASCFPSSLTLWITLPCLQPGSADSASAVF